MPDAALGVVAFDVWLWRQGWILRIHKRPWIGGLWRVSLQPDARSQIPDSGNHGPIECYLVVDQDFWSVSLVLLTAESRSDSRAAAFVGRNSSSRRQLLSFTYDNVPKQQHLERSPKSAGACDLTAGRGAPTRIEGSYFTDRLTAGSMQLELVDRTTTHENFIDAKAHADSSR